MIQEKEQLEVVIADSRDQLGEIAAEAVFNRINELLLVQESINMIFAAAPSQNEFLQALIQKPIEWSRIVAFHMDEYIGLAEEAPQSFGNFLKERLFSKVQFKNVHYIKGNASNAVKECSRYSELLQEYPADIICLGIGENTHIAFNDPHVADFNDPALVKIVDLDEACRIQQVNDGCFKNIEDVPTYAITLTVPALFNAKYAFCIVPGANKAQAVYHTLKKDVGALYPSTILRKHPNAILYLDKNSSALI